MVDQKKNILTLSQMMLPFRD